MFNILCIGDPHLKIEEQEHSTNFINTIQNILINTPDIHLIIILGDILHTHEKLHSGSLNLALQLFKICKNHTLTYCLVGNHDATSNTIFLSDNHWLNVCKEWSNFIVVDKPCFYQTNISSEQIQLCFMPYVPDGKFLQALYTIDENIHDWSQSHVIFAHQLFDGAKMGHIIARNVEEWKEEYPLCISGHIHQKQKVQPNLYYVGSSTYVGYADTTKKSCTLLTFSLNEENEIKIKMKDIDLNLPKKLTITLNITPDIDDHSKLKKDYPITTKFIFKGSQEEIKHFKQTSTYKKLIQKGHSCLLKINSSSNNILNNTNITSSQPTSKKTFLELLKDNIKDDEILLQYYNKYTTSTI